MQSFITDEYFESGHSWLKVKQTVLAFLMWLVVLLPIVIGYYLLNHPATHTFERIFATHLYHLLATAALFLLVFGLILCIQTNLHFSHRVSKHHTYDVKKLHAQSEVIEDFYTERFGDKESRESTRYTSIPVTKNIDTETLTSLKL